MKGLLSAATESKSAISRIVRDLSHPGSIVAGALHDLTDKLYSLSAEEGADSGDDVDPRLFVVCTEEHGIPQTRRPMFIIGHPKRPESPVRHPEKLKG